jgi:membrane fusion protein (multidrug efflux system)
MLKKLWQNKPNFVAALAFICVGFWLLYVISSQILFVKSVNAWVQGDYTNLSTQVSGQVTRVYVNSGQFVQKGQLLCQIDSRLLQSKLVEIQKTYEALQAQSYLAQRNFSRSQRLYKEKVLPISQFQEALYQDQKLEQQILEAAAQVKMSRLALSYAQLYAPEDGRIAYRNAQPGLYFSEGSPLFGFVSNRERWIFAKIRETDLDGIRINSKVQISIDAYPGQKFEGHIESMAQASEGPFAAVAPVFEQGNFKKYVQWVALRISLDLPENEKIQLPIGLTTEISLRRRG